MTTTNRFWLVMGLALALTLVSAAVAEEPQSAPSDSTGEYYVIETRHRLFPEFRQIDTVGFGEVFLVGEEEWQAKVIMFNPHLGITQSGKALQQSDTLYNPAVRVRVEQADSLVQESWGFHFTDAPHFRRTDLLGFKLVSFKVGPQYIAAPKKD